MYSFQICNKWENIYEIIILSEKIKYRTAAIILYYLQDFIVNIYMLREIWRLYTIFNDSCHTGARSWMISFSSSLLEFHFVFLLWVLLYNQWKSQLSCESVLCGFIDIWKIPPGFISHGDHLPWESEIHL